jgi:four helix bundle suffix protein
MPENDHFLSPLGDYKRLIAFKKSECIYDITYYFIEHYLHMIGDRTVDQMKQAARSGKQNIVEGSADGVTSTEMEAKLLNVARASIRELKEDYLDYLRSHKLTLWDESHPRYTAMQRFCQKHNKVEEYEPYFDRWTDEKMANAAVTLCCMVDTMMQTYQKKKEKEFVTEGGIKERMTAARLGFRSDKKEELEAAYREINTLRTRLHQLEQENARLHQLEQENARLRQQLYEL